MSCTLASAAVLSGCAFFQRGEPTRTPIPTFTPTPIVVVVPAGSVPTDNAPQPNREAVSDGAAPLQAQQAAPQSATSTPAPTSTPTSPPTATQTATPAATATQTPTLTPTPIPDYEFELESAQKFPTESLAPGVVRVYVYAYAPGSFGLPGYGLRIVHNGASLTAEAESEGGLPELTRREPGPYSRFTNLNVIIVEAQAGEWEVQLVDADGRPVGPAATFDLTADENTRELYVRYRQISE